jgi:hypothetical protein
MVSLECNSVTASPTEPMVVGVQPGRDTPVAVTGMIRKYKVSNRCLACTSQSAIACTTQP